MPIPVGWRPGWRAQGPRSHLWHLRLHGAEREPGSPGAGETLMRSGQGRGSHQGQPQPTDSAGKLGAQVLGVALEKPPQLRMGKVGGAGRGRGFREEFGARGWDSPPQRDWKPPGGPAEDVSVLTPLCKVSRCPDDNEGNGEGCVVPIPFTRRIPQRSRCSLPRRLQG